MGRRVIDDATWQKEYETALANGETVDQLCSRLGVGRWVYDRAKARQEKRGVKLKPLRKPPTAKTKAALEVYNHALANGLNRSYVMEQTGQTNSSVNNMIQRYKLAPLVKRKKTGAKLKDTAQFIQKCGDVHRVGGTMEDLAVILKITTKQASATYHYLKRIGKPMPKLKPIRVNQKTPNQSISARNKKTE